jgi:hypothetical protein
MAAEEIAQLVVTEPPDAPPSVRALADEIRRLQLRVEALERENHRLLLRCAGQGNVFTPPVPPWTYGSPGGAGGSPR